MNPEGIETAVLRKLSDCSSVESSEVIESNIFSKLAAVIESCDTSSVANIRTTLSPCWRVTGNCLEVAIAVTDLSHAHALFRVIHAGFQSIGSQMQRLIFRGGFDPSSRDAAMILGPFYLAYTSAVRATVESVHCVADPMLGCDMLLGLETFVPMDNKGISNVYKRVRQVSETASVSTPTSSPMDTFEDGNVTMEDAARSFERYWTMMDVSRKLEPELLSDTKSWGKFSQSATATLNLISEQMDPMDAVSNISKEPVEYDCKDSSFAIQMSSASFRRRAVLNIINTCAYVCQNSPNALITAASKTVLSSALKSMPSELQSVMNVLIRFDNHWVSWKSSVQSKEVCAPFLKRSRAERGLDPLGEPLVNLTEIVGSTTAIPEQQPIETVMRPEPVIPNIFQSRAGPMRRESLRTKIGEYRQYVNDAILCDISDNAEKERLSSSDQGMEEAMRNNNDRVLLWQFRRMRLSTDMHTFRSRSS